MNEKVSKEYLRKEKRKKQKYKRKKIKIKEEVNLKGIEKKWRKTFDYNETI